MRSARRIGQRIMMLHEGKIYFEGTPDEVFSSEDPIVSRFVTGVADPKDHSF
jgi:ABC-type transporter Mla maintaining outer membrane lipid asymmetry ATPase subunit MlaF